MKTIKNICAFMGVSTLLAVPGAFSQQLYITAPGYTANGNQAGPYTVQLIGSTSGLGDPVYTGADAQALTYTGATVAFQTFCIASTVDYSPNSTFYYQANTSVQPFSGENQSAPETYVTWGTAYLYNAFLHNPSNFGGTGNGAADDALQEAIWTLQNQSYSGISLGGTSQSAVAPFLYNDLLAATNAAAAAHLSVTGNANEAFGVEALNMSTSSSLNGSWVQPQLIDLANGSQGSPVPEPSTVIAAAMLLLPLGAGICRSLRNNRAASL